MVAERFLVTGALGCIGASTVKRLLDEDIPVWTYDLGSSKHRLSLLMSDEALEQVNFITGDIADFDAFEHAVADNGITHIVHLAAMLAPFVKADPVLGARVNLVGTAVVLEVAHRHSDHVQSLSYASSVGVYGPPGKQRYETSYLYGIHKQANEGMARIYWQDYGLHSIGLRPNSLYGLARDHGLTSLPTKGMFAAAVGRSYRIGYGGDVRFTYANDAAGAFIKAARTRYNGAPALDMDGSLVSVADVIATIEKIAPEMVGRITADPTPLPIATDVDLELLTTVLGSMDVIPFEEGVRQTMEQFRAAASMGKVDVDKILSSR